MHNEVLNIYIASKWLPMGAHNGYLELGLAFGIIGLPVLFYVLWRSFRMATDYMKSSEEWFSVWPMTYLLLFAFHNFFESHLLETRSLEFLLFVAITTSLAVERRVIAAQAAPAYGRALLLHRKDQVYSPIVR